MCEIMQGSHQNGKNNHMLHSFYRSMEPDFKIVETPSHVIYLQITLQADNITSVVHEGDTVDIRGEVTTKRQDFKRIL